MANSKEQFGLAEVRRLRGLRLLKYPLLALMGSSIRDRQGRLFELIYGFKQERYDKLYIAIDAVRNNRTNYNAVICFKEDDLNERYVAYDVNEVINRK